VGVPRSELRHPAAAQLAGLTPRPHVGSLNANPSLRERRSGGDASLDRRKLLGLGAAVLACGGRALAETPPALTPAAIEPREVAFHNLHTGESLKAVYWDRGRYVPDALEAVNKVLRDFRTGDEHAMDPLLLDVLNAVHGKVEANRPFQVISGYRSPRTNAMLHEHSHGAASGSLHMQGMAIDVRVEGVQLTHLHKAALDLGRGGVGLYPLSDFVHMDVGRVRRWYGA
jgi:uncharacterized protein YcbK (DUF882 family)